jgi:hypothetical protein
MFNQCTNLVNGPTISLDLSELGIYAAYTFASMFNGCGNLGTIKFDGGGLLYSNNFLNFGSDGGLF